MKLSITVTADDIKKGIKDDAEWCPLARAIRRDLKATSVAVAEFSEGGINVDNIGTSRVPGADAFISRFDAGKPVAPRTFVLTF